MDGIFLFEDVSVEDSKNVQGYDAIVVEQWTVLKVCVQIFFFDFFVNQNIPRLWGKLWHTDLCFNSTRQTTEVKGCNITIAPVKHTLGLYGALLILIIPMLYCSGGKNASDGE